MKDVQITLSKLHYHKIMFITKFVWNIHHLAVMHCRDYNSALIDSSHGNHHGIFHISISLTLTYSIAYWKNIREQYSLYNLFFWTTSCHLILLIACRAGKILSKTVNTTAMSPSKSQRGNCPANAQKQWHYQNQLTSVWPLYHTVLPPNFKVQSFK